MTDPVQEWEGLEIGVGYLGVGGGDFGANLLAQAGLVFWVLVEEVAGPG